MQVERIDILNNAFHELTKANKMHGSKPICEYKYSMYLIRKNAKAFTFPMDNF